MYPRQYALFGLVFALILLIIFPEMGLMGFFLIVISTILIDIDHYVYYIYKEKDWNLKKAYQWFFKNCKKYSSLSRKQKDKYYSSFSFLHGIEILIILFILGKFLSIYFYYPLIGFAFHLFLDTIHKIILKERIDKLSIIYNFFKFRKLKFIQEMTNERD